MVTPIEMRDFLHYYGYDDATEEGCQRVYDLWEKNKAPLLEKFRKHPNWDEENLAIVFKEAEYERGFDTTAMDRFISWASAERDKMVQRVGYDDSRLVQIQDLYDAYITNVRYARENIKNLEREGVKLDLMPDFDVTQVRTKRNAIEKVRTQKLEDAATYFVGRKSYFIPTKLHRDINCVFNALNYISINCKSQFISHEEADGINERCPDVKVSEGLKLTKAVQRLCKVIGLDKIKDVRPAHEGTDRLKDFGFNHHFQELADSINPVKYKLITVISLNPLDYWGMSFGYKWASCHTIDKWHKRNNDDSSHHYSGCYSAGTESYMLDSSSIIFYVIREDFDGNVYYDEDKRHRVVFCVNDNASMILESRVYPDGRDGGDASLAGQFRNVMQKVISEVYDINNYWRVEKGTSTCHTHTESIGPHYKDYYNYSDVNISFNKDECMDFPKIRIGHNAVCPGCGTEHYGEKNIMCWSCGGEENDEDCVTCEHCGEVIHLNRDDYEYAGDSYFCCRDCAEREGYRMCWDNDEWYYEDDVHLCEDDGHYHNEYNCYRDDYDDDYYSGEPYIVTNDGYTYSCVENAEADGYVKEFFSEEWMRADRLTYDEFEESYFDGDRDEVIITADGKYFPTENSAWDAGYTETRDGEWMKEDDAIEIDGEFYADEDEARRYGYELNENGEWILAESEVTV